jgi:hypothetical protein
LVVIGGLVGLLVWSWWANPSPSSASARDVELPAGHAPHVDDFADAVDEQLAQPIAAAEVMPSKPEEAVGGDGPEPRDVTGDEQERDGVDARPPEASTTKTIREERRDAVRRAMQHAWGGYTTHAYGHDEVRPVTNATNDSWGGWGATLIDALDTLWLMEMHDEFARARDHVAQLNFKVDKSVSVFETTIRIVGGLLGAYELSKDELFLQKADELATLLLPAFETPQSLPYHEVNLMTGVAKNPGWTRGSSILAEVGSIQVSSGLKKRRVCTILTTLFRS